MSDAPTYIGKVQPQDANTDSNLMLLFIRQALDRVNIATYCSVVAVYGGGLSAPPTVDVLPLLNTLDGLKNSQSLQVPVHGLQVYRYQGGTNAVICDPQVGDIGKVIVCDRDTSSVDSNNNGVSASVGTPKQSNPSSGRRFNLSDGTFFPCVLGAAPVQYIWFKPDGIYAQDKNGNSITMNGTGITIQDFNGNKITMSSSGIVITDKSGNKADLTSGSGEVTINTHTLTQHKHFVNSVQTGSSNVDSQTPTG